MLKRYACRLCEFEILVPEAETPEGIWNHVEKQHETELKTLKESFSPPLTWKELWTHWFAQNVDSELVSSLKQGRDPRSNKPLEISRG